MLSDSRAIDGRKCEARNRVGISVLLQQECETCAVAFTRAVLVDAPVGADPELLPLSDQRVVGIQTLPLPAPGARPVLEQRAAPAHELNHTTADRCAVFGCHIPFADPE